MGTAADLRKDENKESITKVKARPIYYIYISAFTIENCEELWILLLLVGRAISPFDLLELLRERKLAARYRTNQPADHLIAL